MVLKFLLAYSKAENKDANTIAELIEEFRKPFSEGKVASIGAMTMANAETWAKIAEESESAAKCELLKNSAELSELERLKKAADEAANSRMQKKRRCPGSFPNGTAFPTNSKRLTFD